MSKTEGKRGLRRTQHTSAILATNSPQWDEAVAAFEAAEKTHDEACRALNHRDIPQDTLAAYFAARDRLMGTQAINGAQLAYKIASHDDAPDFRHPDVIAATVEGDDDNEKAWLALYFDALALSGVQATVAVPAIPKSPVPAEAARLDWRGIVDKAGEVFERFGGMRAGPAMKADWEVSLAMLTEHAAALAALPEAERTVERVVEAATAAERFGRELAEGSDGYRNWAVNPDGLRELVERATLIQESARELARLTHPGVSGIAIQRAFFSDDDTPPTPPRGPGGGLPLPSRIGGLLAIRADAKAAYDGGEGEDDGPAFRRVEEAERAIIATRATDPADIAAKLAMGWPGGSEALTDLTPETAPMLAQHQNDKVATVASAYLDLIGLGARASQRRGDPTVVAYHAARQASADYGHGLDESQGKGHDPADITDLAADAMLATPPLDMAGVRSRLGRIIAEAFIHQAGDLDCPHCQHQREAVQPATTAELCGAGEGFNGQGDALLRALLTLYGQTEVLAGDNPAQGNPAALKWFEARALLARAEAAADKRWIDPDADPLVTNPEVSEEEAKALSLAMIEAQHRVAEEAPPTVAEAAWKAGFLFATFMGAGADPRDPGGVEWLTTEGGINDGFMASLYLDLVRLAGSQAGDPANCPAAAIIRQIETELDAEGATAGTGPEWSAHFDARMALADRATEVQATSLVGAAGQIALALDRAELIRGNTAQAVRDEHHEAAERLIRSALGALGGLSASMWAGYIGGLQPLQATAVTVEMDGARFLAWEAEAERLMAEYRARDVALTEDEDEAETERLFDAALRLLYQILTEPGSGATVAAVKLRSMLHPEVGVARLVGQMGTDDAEGIHTALAALTGEQVFNPFAWIRDYEAGGGRVRKVRVDIGGDDDRFALLLSHPDTPEAAALHARLTAKAQGHDATWALFHACQNEVMPGAEPRTVAQISKDEAEDGRDVAAVVFPPLSEGAAQ